MHLSGQAHLQLAGLPLAEHVVRLTRGGLCELDALVKLLEWAIYCRPQSEVEGLLDVIAPFLDDVGAEVTGDVRWLQAAAAVRSGRFGLAIAALAPFHAMEVMLGRPLESHERGPQVLAAPLVADIERELGRPEVAAAVADQALGWIADLGVTDPRSYRTARGQQWRGLHVISCELRLGLASDAVAMGDLDRARDELGAARSWLPDGARSFPQPWWRQRVELLLVRARLASARGDTRSAVRDTRAAVRIASLHHGLPYVVRSLYHLGVAELRVPFDVVGTLLDRHLEVREEHRRDALRTLYRAAYDAGEVGLPAIEWRTRLALCALLTPDDPQRAELQFCKAKQLAAGIAEELPGECRTIWQVQPEVVFSACFEQWPPPDEPQWRHLRRYATAHLN